MSGILQQHRRHTFAAPHVSGKGEMCKDGTEQAYMTSSLAILLNLNTSCSWISTLVITEKVFSQSSTIYKQDKQEAVAGRGKRKVMDTKSFMPLYCKVNWYMSFKVSFVPSERWGVLLQNKSLQNIDCCLLQAQLLAEKWHNSLYIWLYAEWAGAYSNHNRDYMQYVHHGNNTL